MANNEGKWKVFQNAVGLDGPPGVRQNLNEDLQENLGNELDHVVRRHQGSCVASGWAVTAGVGLSVSVATGVGFVDGQIVGGSGSVSSLTANTANLKVYVQAGTPWGNGSSQWPASFGFTAGALTSTQMLLALVTTGASTVTTVTDQRIFTDPVSTLIGSIDDTVTPAAAATSLKNRLGMLARRVKEIIGGSSWLDAIPLSLTALNAKFHEVAGHKHTGVAGDGAKIDPTTGLTYVPLNKAGDAMSGGFLTLANEPTQPNHAATRAYADTKLPISGNVTMTGPLGLSTPLHAAYGGTGINAYAVGDTLYAAGGQTLARRGAGAQGHVYTMSGGVPVWAPLVAPAAPVRWLVQGYLVPFAKIAQVLLERDVTFRTVRVWTDNIPGNQPIVLDINRNGASIWSNQGLRVQVPAWTNAGAQTAFNTTTALAGDRLSLDIDQAGTGGGAWAGGADLLVVVEFW